MRWVVCVLAVATILLSVGSMYFTCATGMPDLDELGIPPEDAPDMRMITAYIVAKELIAILTAGAALLYAFAIRSTSISRG